MFVVVVYLLIPTSNHNVAGYADTKKSVVYLLIPTSNHNIAEYADTKKVVVYLLIPTSNHNLDLDNIRKAALYIF